MILEVTIETGVLFGGEGSYPEILYFRGFARRNKVLWLQTWSVRAQARDFGSYAETKLYALCLLEKVLRVRVLVIVEDWG